MVALAFAVWVRRGPGIGPVFSAVISAPEDRAEEAREAKPAATVSDGVVEQSAAPSGEVKSDYFPKATVISRAVDPVDAQGRQRVIETVETTMAEPYVRLERTFSREGGGPQRAGSEVAMVANQLLLQKPDSLDKATFQNLLRQAGARQVKQIGDAFLATFAAQPQDPRALDEYVGRVRAVAGAGVMVEPNYIRRLF